MACDWRGYRLLVAGDRRFRWECRFVYPIGWTYSPDDWQRDELIGRCEDNPAQVLTVRWPAGSGGTVTPKRVREWIDAARERGWPAQHPVVEMSGSDIRS